MRKYHLSYDVIDCDVDFDGNYETARKLILEIIKELEATSVKSPCESTIIFTYPGNDFNMIDFNKKAKDYFYYSIGLIAKSDMKIYERINSSLEIDDENLQYLWNNIRIKSK